MKEEPEDQLSGADRMVAPPLGLAGAEEEPGEQHIVRGID